MSKIIIRGLLLTDIFVTRLPKALKTMTDIEDLQMRISVPVTFLQHQATMRGLTEEPPASVKRASSLHEQRRRAAALRCGFDSCLIARGIINYLAFQQLRAYQSRAELRKVAVEF